MPTDPASRAAIVLLMLGLAGAAQAEAPLSAIDWLSQSVSAPNGTRVALPPQGAAEPAVTSDARPAEVTVSVLGAPGPDAIGLIDPAETGLPKAFWGMGRTRDIAVQITRESQDVLPALQSLTTTLLLAKSDPPVDSAGRGILLMARIDKLLAMGALDHAAALLEQAGTESEDLFRRRFDVALLTGNEDRACDEMRRAPQLAPTLSARIFCLARAGDWNAAALTLHTAQALGHVTEMEDALLSHFLDPELVDESDPLPPPQRVTPLVWRMYEAIGEPLPTNGLPLAFAHADLSPQSGWKAQLEAAERLARAGAISPDRLLAVFTAHQPAASGGIWDRVSAFQRFDAAIVEGDAAAVAIALARVWPHMQEAELEVPFATLYAESLMAMDLPEDAAALAFRIGLLSPQYEIAAKAHKTASPDEAFLIGIATGNLSGAVAQNGMARALAPAFQAPKITEDAQALMDENRIGEALLLAVDQIAHSVSGDPRGVAEGISLLRKLGLEDAARRTALELLLLERRG